MSMPPNPYHSPQSFGTPPPKPNSDGMLTAVAIVNFVLGGLNALWGFLVVFGGSLIAAIFGQARGIPGGGNEVAAFGGFVAMIFMFAGIMVLLNSVLLIFAGLGVVQRKEWGKILTLVAGGLAAATALMSLQGANAVPALLNIGYCVFVFIVLLNPQYAREFR